MSLSRVSFFFVKQKTAYEMRISDWSSDVCSSDLQRRAHVGEPAADAGLHGGVVLHHLVETVAVVEQGRGARGLGHVGGQAGPGGVEIGRASCRERGCQYV